MADRTAPADDPAIGLEQLLDRAREHGADAADALALKGRSLSIGFRLGELEEAERSETRGFSLRALVGHRQAVASTADASPGALEALAERVVAMAKAATEDPHAGLADSKRLAAPDAIPVLDLLDATDIGEDRLRDLAREVEDAARAVEGVSNSGGAGATHALTEVHLANSDGFAASYAGTVISLSVSVLAGEGTAMERDYAMCTRRHFEDLESPAAIGRRAGRRAVARLGSGRMPTGRMPVVFDPRVAGSLVGHFAQAVNGAAVARGTSFLKDSMHARLFPPGVTIVDDPLRPRGLRSKPFDGEGVATAGLSLVEDGRLLSWMLDSATARKLGLETTGHAARGLSNAPSPGATNLYLAAGPVTRNELICDIPRGLYVTELIGMGVNPVTGDYSRGAAGFLIEDGAITRPVSELTIAGNLKAMFAGLTPASDLEFRYGIDAPTCRLESMTVAGI